MTDLIHPADRADRKAARLLLKPLLEGVAITRRMINDAMLKAYGGSDAEGYWTQRECFEVLEHALALHLCADASPPSLAMVRSRIALMERLATQTVRSEEQSLWQQFSTPLDIAALAIVLARIDADDVVLEPSAGNGLLVAQCPPCRRIHLNEIDPARRARLADSFPDAVITGHDGATISSTLAQAERPTVILMNPPFSRSLGRGADDYAAVRHLQSALRRLIPGGRLVAIMPDWFGPGARMKVLFDTSLREMSVRTALRLEKCYLKHGTSIAVSLFVIDNVPGGAMPATISRTGLVDFLDVVHIPERAAVKSDAAVLLPERSSGVSMFRALRSRRAEPRPYLRP